MKVIVFGATGSIGRHLTEQSLELGYDVTAFARRPQKLGVKNPDLTLVAGNVLDLGDVTSAIEGHDAVIIALGDGAKGKIRYAGTKVILDAMAATGVDRLICMSSLGAGDSRRNLNFFWKRIMFGLLLRKAYADHQRQDALVRQSNVDWTIVRPAAFIDGPMTGRYLHGFSARAKNLRLKISRADVAHFMLGQLDDDNYLHATPGLSY